MNRTENESPPKKQISNIPESYSQIIQQNQNVSQPQIDSNSLNQLLSVIYDDEFVIMINDLSHSIKIYNKAMIQFINLTKTIISNNISFFENLTIEKDKEIKTFPNIFNLIETNYNNFFSTAKIIFKKMKKYRNERLENINKLPITENNLKFCFINFNKKNSSPNENVAQNNIINNENKTIEKNIYNPSPIPNRNFPEKIIYEENAELKKKLFNLEKKIEIIGNNNKKNIITNNINNISNFHLQENKPNEVELIRENKNITKAIKNLINIIEYEYSPEYSYSKNTFDNMDEIEEHKKEIKQQKEELINTIKIYLSNVEINKITDNIEINFNSNIHFLKKIEEMKQVIEKLESQNKSLTTENKNYIEDIKKLDNENKKLKEENDLKITEISEENQKQISSYIEQINQLKNEIKEDKIETEENQNKYNKEKIDLKEQINMLNSEKITSQEKMLKIIQQKNIEISNLINERNDIIKEKNELNEKMIKSKEKIKEMSEKEEQNEKIKNQLKEELTKNKEIIGNMKLELDKLNEENNNKISKDDLNKLENQIKEKEDEIKNIKDEIQIKIKELKENENKIYELTEQKTKDEEKYNQLLLENNKLFETNNTLTIRNQKQEDYEKELLKKIEILSEENNQNKKEIEIKLKEINDKYNIKIITLKIKK